MQHWTFKELRTEPVVAADNVSPIGDTVAQKGMAKKSMLSRTACWVIAGIVLLLILGGIITGTVVGVQNSNNAKDMIRGMKTPTVTIVADSVSGRRLDTAHEDDKNEKIHAASANDQTTGDYMNFWRTYNVMQISTLFACVMATIAPEDYVNQGQVNVTTFKQDPKCPNYKFTFMTVDAKCKTDENPCPFNATMHLTHVDKCGDLNATFKENVMKIEYEIDAEATATSYGSFRLFVDSPCSGYPEGNGFLYNVTTNSNGEYESTSHPYGDLIGSWHYKTTIKKMVRQAADTFAALDSPIYSLKLHYDNFNRFFSASVEPRFAVMYKNASDNKQMACGTYRQSQTVDGTVCQSGCFEVLTPGIVSRNNTEFSDVKPLVPGLPWMDGSCVPPPV